MSAVVVEIPQRLNAFAAVMIRPVHQLADRIGLHSLSGVGSRQRKESDGLLDRGIEPDGLGPLRQD